MLSRRVGGRSAPLPGDDQQSPDRVRKPRVALVAHDIHDRGGMERALAELIRRTWRSVDYVVVAGSLAPDLRALVQWRRVRMLRRPFPVKFGLFYLLAGLALARLDVDLVHTTGAIVARRVDLASVHYCHARFRDVKGALAPRGARIRRVNSALSRAMALAAERRCYRAEMVTAVAAVSEGVAAELRDHYPTVPVLVTPNGVDGDRFRPDDAARREERSSAGVGPECVVALFVGGEWDRKGLALAIEGLAMARAAGCDALQLWVVGRGDRKQYQGMARRLGVEDHVRFFGFRSDTERSFQAADLLVLPSLYETFSLVAYEAATCGLPVVATDCSGVHELVGEDQGGVLIPHTAAAVGQALGLLARDAVLRQQMGESACRRAAAYTWQRSAESVLEAYRFVLSNAHTRALVAP